METPLAYVISIGVFILGIWIIFAGNVSAETFAASLAGGTACAAVGLASVLNEIHNHTKRGRIGEVRRGT